MTGTAPELGTRESPLYFKWVRDDNGDINWAKIAIMLAVTVLSGYLATRSQRWGSSSLDPVRTARLAVAKKEISLGHRLQKAGRALEEHGWETYSKASPAG